jgi:hypothetical protein
MDLGEAGCSRPPECYWAMPANSKAVVPDDIGILRWDQQPQYPRSRWSRLPRAEMDAEISISGRIPPELSDGQFGLTGRALPDGSIGGGAGSCLTTRTQPADWNRPVPDLADPAKGGSCKGEHEAVHS